MTHVQDAFGVRPDRVRRGTFTTAGVPLAAAATLGFVTLLPAIAPPLRASAPGSVTWLSDYPAAQAIARHSGKPLFVAFR